MFGDYNPHWGRMATLMPPFRLAPIGFGPWAVLGLTPTSAVDIARRGLGPDGRESPEETVDRRVASGEIDAAARQQLKAHPRQSDEPGASQ